MTTTEAGRCGATTPDSAQHFGRPTCCGLPAGHAGWHHDRALGTEWGLPWVDLEPSAVPCGCNQPDATHSRGDEAFCRAWQAADRLVKEWRHSGWAGVSTTDADPLRQAMHRLDEVWPE